MYGGASTADRRRVHGALADVTDPALDQDRWAWHRAAAVVGPDEKVALALEETAERSRSRGGHAAVASALTRAAELTPDSNRRGIRYLAAAEEAVAADQGERAEELLKRGAADFEEPALRAAARKVHGDICCVRYHPNAVPVLIDAARSLAEFDPSLARDAWLAALHVEIILSRDSSGATLRGIGQAAISQFADSEPPKTLPDLLLHGFATRLAVGYAESLPSLRQAISMFCDHSLQIDIRPPWIHLVAIATADLVDDAARLAVTERLGHLCREQGTMHNLAIALLGQAIIELEMGRFERAEALYAQSHDVRSISGEWWNKDLEIELPSWQGRESQTYEAAANLRKEQTVVSVNVLVDKALLVLELGRGRYVEALACAKRLYEDDPLRYGTRVLTDVVEAAVRAGDNDTASMAFERLSIRFAATGTPLAMGRFALARALMEGCATADAQYREAVDRLTEVDSVIDRARAHLLYGEWLRREKRRVDSRGQLRVAYEMFSDVGAEGFAERARVELQATGETARKRSSATQLDLTPRERQIAQQAAGGATNSEIASHLFLSANTVDFHLKKVFRKLGITSRRQLSGRLEGRL